MKSSFALLTVCAALIAGPVFGEEPQAAPSPGTPGTEEYLLLPAFDVAVQAGKETKVGDRLPVNVEVQLPGVGPQDLQVDFSANPEDSGFHLSRGKVQQGLAFTAVPIKPGTLTLPSLPIKNAQGTAVARTHPLTVKVSSAISKDDPKPTQPAELRPPVSLPYPWLWFGLFALFGLALLAGAIYAFIRWRNSRKKPMAAPVPPPRPEDEVALAELDALEKAGHLKRGEFKKYYFKISELLKIYIGLRYRFDAPESTSREIISTLEEGKRVSDQWLDRLEAMFRLLDRVKFTDHVPEAGEPERLLEDARKFVRETRKPPVAALTPEQVQKEGAGSAVR